MILDAKSLQYRKQILQILAKCGRGHIGSAFSIIEICRVLYEDVLKFDASQPDWPERDRFILSKGHGCLGLYVILAEHGYFDSEELFRFCSPGGILGGHPEKETTPGIEASTGSLGHGLSIGAGMALAAKMDNKTYKTYVLLGDGECNEGSVWEAAMFIKKHDLSNLTVLIDANGMQCYSSTADVLDLEPMDTKWRSFGFDVIDIDGHDLDAIRKAFALVDEGPRVIICRTTKGKGVDSIENNPNWHHKARLNEDELNLLLENIK